MADAISIAKIAGPETVDRALGVAAIHGRFGANDLLSLPELEALMDELKMPHAKAVAADLLAIEQGKKVAWFRLEELGALIRSHKPDQSIPRAINRILTADLIIIDDIGLLSVTNDAAEGLYRVVDAGYEKRSIAVSSNIHPAGFDKLMPITLATATVGRLRHQAHVCETSGDSIRLTEALNGKGPQAA